MTRRWLVLACCVAQNAVFAPKVKVGIEVLESQNFQPLQGKRVGLITNPTGVTGDLRSTIDVLKTAQGVHLVALFGPEHGVRGDMPGGQHIEHYTDQRTGLPVYSLYGPTRKPTPEMLNGMDALVYDIQDIGTRAYTYIYTMAYAMEAAGEKGIEFYVLDRPNPLGGERVEGPVLDPRFKSFIGLYPIPYIYGMTVGELARLLNAEFGIGAKLRVIPMAGWQRAMTFQETGLPWVPTSPHVPHATTPLFEATTGVLGELGTVNEGVGYTLPFELVGAPWVDPDRLAEELNRRRLPGVYFRPLYYRPFYSSLQGQRCGGVQIHILDPRAYRAMATQVHLLEALQKLYPEQRILSKGNVKSFDQAMGTDAVRLALESGETAESIIAKWQEGLQEFLKKRARYLLY